MSNERPNYEELEQRLTEAQQIIAALCGGEVDAIVGEREVALPCLKEMENALRRSEENYRNSMEKSPLGIRIATEKGELLYANQAILDIHGYSSLEELRAVPAKQRYTPESYAEHEKRKAKRRRGEYVPSNYEISIVTKDGEIRHLEVFRKEVLWNGKTQFQMLYKDITERRRMDRLLRNQHDLAVALGSTSQLKEGARLCLEAVLDISGMDCGGFYLVDKASGALDLLFHQGLSSDFVKSVAHYAADSANAKLVTAGKPVHTEHSALGVPLSEAERREGLRAIAVVPVSHEGRVIGCFNIASHALGEVPAFARDTLETVIAQTGNAIARLQAEEALRESEATARALIDSPVDSVLLLNPEGIILDTNQTFAQHIGRRVDELIGRCIYDFFPPELAKSRRVRVEEIVHFGVPIRFDDERAGMQLDHSAHPIRDAQGKITKIAIVARDVTARRRAEEAFHDLEGRYRELYQSMMDAFVLTDMDGHILEFNTAFLNLLGYSADELKTLTYFDITPQKWHDVEAEIIQEQVMKCGYSGIYEKECRRRDGTIFPIELRTLLLRDHLGTPVSMWAIIRDITERKRAEEALKETNRNLQAVIQASPLAIVVLDFRRNVTKWNPAAEQIFGWSEKEVLGRPLPTVPEKKQEEFQEFFDKALRGETFRSLESPCRGKNGAWIDASISTAPLFDENGQISGIITLFEDITQSKKAEMEKEQLLDQLRAGQERLRELSRRMVSVQETERRRLARELHDKVGQNLTVLGINLNIIRDLMPEESSPKISDRIDDSQKLLEGTVVSIRNVMAKLRPPVLDDFGLVAALHWYCGKFSERTGINTKVRGEELNPRLPLQTETALFRITQEALNNVAKHAKASHVTLTIEQRDDSAWLSIVDNGMGFDPETHHQPEGQPEWGMINMRERAHSLGGQLRVETAPAKGTKIIVEVPRQTDAG